MKVIDRRNRYGFDTISCFSYLMFLSLCFFFFFLFPISKKFFAQSGMIKISDLTGMITCRSESNDHWCLLLFVLFLIRIDVVTPLPISESLFSFNVSFISRTSRIELPVPVVFIIVSGNRRTHSGNTGQPFPALPDYFRHSRKFSIANSLVH